MTPHRTLLAAACAFALAACSPAPEPPAVESPAPDPAPATEAAVERAVDPAGAIQLAASARVVLAPVQDSGAGGELRFDIAEGGVAASGKLTGLKPGTAHGFHVHETGDCSAPDAMSAGGHFNPQQSPHGARDGSQPHHAGDMPNQQADANGEAAVDVHLGGLEIGSGGEMDIVGKAVIVHAQADDYTSQPAGNAGARIACGVIELENAPPAMGGPAE